jgi:hypothetical protein
MVKSRVGWVELFAKPITVVANMMGIASLNPSYALVVLRRAAWTRWRLSAGQPFAGSGCAKLQEWPNGSMMRA